MKDSIVREHEKRDSGLGQETKERDGEREEPYDAPQHMSRGRTEKEREASVSEETAWNNRDFVGCVGGTGRERERGREGKKERH